MTDKLSYNTREAAKVLGISEDKVKQEIRAGRLRAVRTSKLRETPTGALRGGKFLIPEDALREWLDALEVA